MIKRMATTCAWPLLCLLSSQAPAHAAPHEQEPATPDPRGGNAYKVPAFLHNPDPDRSRLAPDIEVFGLDGEHFTSADLRGRVILFEFWWSECFGSVRRVSYLKSLTRQWAEEPFILISVHTGGDTEEMRQLVAKYSMDWPQYQYTEKLRSQFQIQEYPTHILVDHESDIVFRESGWSDRVEDRLDWEIDKALRLSRRAED